MIKVNILKCGTAIVDEALPLSNRSKNPFAYTGIARGKSIKYLQRMTGRFNNL